MPSQPNSVKANGAARLNMGRNSWRISVRESISKDLSQKRLVDLDREESGDQDIGTSDHWNSEKLLTDRVL
jgi:hypothetical protein